MPSRFLLLTIPMFGLALLAGSGDTWTTPEVIAGPGNYYTPQVVFASDGGVVVVWQGGREDDYEILMRSGRRGRTSRCCARGESCTRRAS